MKTRFATEHIAPWGMTPLAQASNMLRSKTLWPKIQRAGENQGAGASQRTGNRQDARASQRAVAMLFFAPLFGAVLAFSPAGALAAPVPAATPFAATPFATPPLAGAPLSAHAVTTLSLSVSGVSVSGVSVFGRASAPALVQDDEEKPILYGKEYGYDGWSIKRWGRACMASMPMGPDHFIVLEIKSPKSAAISIASTKLNPYAGTESGRLHLFVGDTDIAPFSMDIGAGKDGLPAQFFGIFRAEDVMGIMAKNKGTRLMVDDKVVWSTRLSPAQSAINAFRTCLTDLSE